MYADQMQFMDKLYESREVCESMEDSNVGDNDRGDVNEHLQPPVQEAEEVVGPQEKVKNAGRKRRRQEEVELQILKALEEPKPNAHMSFFQGLLPHLNKFDDGEVLEFQMSVLQAIFNINNKKRSAQLPPQAPPHYQPTCTFSQPPSFSQQTPPSFSNHPPQSFSNQFNAPPYPQQQFYNSQNNISFTPANQQDSISTKHQHQTAAQFYQQFHSTAASEPPSESPSPSVSVCTDTLSLDFS